MMNFRRLLTVALLAVLTGGCAATVRSSADSPPVKVTAESAHAVVLNIDGSILATKSSDWAQFKALWHSSLKAELAKTSAALSTQEGDANATGDIGTLLVIYIEDFRYVSGGSRFAFGAMTGNAFVQARVSFRDLKSGDPFGERRYDTTSSAWQGVFAPMTDKQVGAICKEIAATLAGH